MALMDDLGKALGGNLDPKELEQLAKNANLNLGDLEKMAKDAGVDTTKINDLIAKIPTKVAEEKKSSSQPDPAQLMGLLGTMDIGKLDIANLDIDTLAKQFGVPAETVKQFMAMLGK